MGIDPRPEHGRMPWRYHFADGLRVRAEILVRVNAASFRGVGEAKAIRNRYGGIEFLHLSAGGKDMLADLVAQLADLQAV